MTGGTVLITGGAGRIGGYLRTRIAAPGRVLRLMDIVDLPTPVAAGEEFVRGSVTDPEALAAAMAGVTAVVHLGGLADEADWETVLAVNVHGTNAVFEAARAAGVGRVVYASSNHAVGYRDYSDGPLPDGLAPLPDSFYGASKAFGEALAGLYVHRHGMDVVCLRIGSCFDLPTNARMLETWLSPDDAGRLFEAALSDRVRGLHLVWGVSANTHRMWSLDAARALGYRPLDDASAHFDAPDVVHPVSRFVGGDRMPTVATSLGSA